LPFREAVMNLGLVEMLRYNAWANSRLFDACSDLSDEQLDARLPFASGPVRELLVHIVGAQQTYVLRTQGRQHEGELTRESPWPGMSELRAQAERTGQELISIADDLDPNAEVDLPYGGGIYRYPRRFFLVHAAEHSVEHRTEVKLTLASVGVDTPDLDGWEYAEFAAYGAQVAGET
jgi:uncharacterized damage-inducible protein DinB